MSSIYDKIQTKIKNYFNEKIDSPYSIISLGIRCSTRTILTRHHLKKTKSEGELTLPFDYTHYVHSRFVTDFLEDNFHDFFKGLYFDEEKKYWSCVGKVLFSREKDYGPNDLNLLIEKYVQRIDNFYKEINKDKLFLFLQVLDDADTGEDVERLFETLRKKVSKPFVFAVIDCANVLPVVVSQNINVLRIAKPSKDYSFYEEKSYNSEEGKEFEKKIINFIESVIKDKLKQKVIKYF